jgi:very-short-patch-repair endonuclease
VAAAPGDAFANKPGNLRWIWRIKHAEHAPENKAFRPARVCADLHVDGVGEAGLAEAAERQAGIVSGRQLVALGFGRGAIAYRRKTGRLHPHHPGVFSVGYPRRDWRARMFAALLYAGDDAVLSHGTGLAVWEIRPLTDEVQLTVAGRQVRPRPGLHVSRVSALKVRDVRMHRGLPVTAPARCLLDHAADADDDEIERALAEARMRRLVSDADLQGALERAPTRPGARRLARVMRSVSGRVITRSKAERLVLRLIADAELPMPEVNAKLLGFEVDFLWRARNLVLEFDGFEFHRHRHQFEADRHRVQVLTAAGYRVIQVTWRQLCEEPLALAVRIGQALVRG